MYLKLYVGQNINVEDYFETISVALLLDITGFNRGLLAFRLKLPGLFLAIRADKKPNVSRNLQLDVERFQHHGFTNQFSNTCYWVGARELLQIIRGLCDWFNI